MKALYLCILSFFILGMNPDLEAQRDLYNWKISPQGGIIHYGSEFQLPENTNLYGVGLSLDHRLGRAWTFGLNFLWMESEGGQVETSKYGGARLGFYWDNGFMLSERAFLTPFHKIGFGYGEETIMRNPNSSVIRTGYAFSFENGLKMRFGDRITVELALEILAPEEIVLSGDVAERNRYHFYKLGLNYHFGRRESTFEGPVFRTTSQNMGNASVAKKSEGKNNTSTDQKISLNHQAPLPMHDFLPMTKLLAPENEFAGMNSDTLYIEEFLQDSFFVDDQLSAADSAAIFMKMDSLYKRRSASDGEKTDIWSKMTTPQEERDSSTSWQSDTTALWHRDTTAYGENDTTFLWRTDTVFIKEMWEPTERIYREEIRYRDARKSSEDGSREENRIREDDRKAYQEKQPTDNGDRRYDDNQKSTTPTESGRSYEDDRRRIPGNTVVVAGTGGGSGNSSDLEEQNRLLREQNELLRSMVSPTAAQPQSTTTNQPRPQRDLFVASTTVTPRRDRTSADSTEAEKRLAFQLDSLKREKERIDQQYQALITLQAYAKLDSLESDSIPFDPDSIPKESIDIVKTTSTRDTITPPRLTAETRVVPTPPAAPPKSDVNYPVVCTFGLNKEIPAQGERDKLDQVANDLKKFPERKATLTGHTDGSGNADYNLTLSKLRAQWVADYLTERGVKTSQLDVRGKGAQESQEKFQPDERRVEIEIGK